MNNRKFDDFDSYASNYRKVHSENLAFSGADSYYFAENKVLELIKEEDGERSLLDLGCGDGVTELFFYKYRPGWRIDAIDISIKSIEEAKSKNIPNTKFEVYNGDTIPFPDNSFDIVFVAAVLHHIDTSLHHNFLKEAYRVLRPKGRLYVFEHNPFNPVTRYLVNTCPFDKDAKLLNHIYCRKLLEKAGFSISRLKFILFFPRTSFFSGIIKLEKYLGWLPAGGQYYFKAVK